MKIKRKKTIAILFVSNLLYYIFYAVLYYWEVGIKKYEGRMIYFGIVLLLMECGTILIGYLLLFLKLRMGQILLVIFCIQKEYLLLMGSGLGKHINIRDIAEMLLFLVFAGVLIFSKDVNNYIKSRKKLNIFRWNKRKVDEMLMEQKMKEQNK